MRCRFSLILVIAALAGCSAADPESSAATTQGATADEQPAFGANLMPVALAQAALPPGAIRLQRTIIMDPNGFDRPLPALSVLAPVGWRAQGGIAWNVQNPCLDDYGVNWSLQGPDGVSAFAFVVRPKWQIVRSYMQYERPRSPCETANWTNVREALEGIARESSPGSRVLDFRLLPELTRELEQYARQLTLPQSEAMQMRTRYEAGEILLAGNVNGREVREVIRATVFFSETRLANLLNPGQIAQEMIEGTPVSLMFMRAPAGQLDTRLADVINKSLVPMAEWSRRTHEHRMKKMEENFRAMIRRGNYNAEVLRQMTARHQASMDGMRAQQSARDASYDSRNMLSDKLQRENVEAIRGVETYHEPVDGGVVQLDNTYDHAWRVRDGTYVLTNDPNFRPGLVGLEGQELRKVE